VKHACEQAVAYCCEHRVNIARLAVHYASTFDGVHSCVVSVRSVAELMDNIDACVSMLSDKERRVMQRINRR
jgi:aryl-alcohol dehydrogenase-like predicted oxidoreductase